MKETRHVILCFPICSPSASLLSSRVSPRSLLLSVLSCSCSAQVQALFFALLALTAAFLFMTALRTYLARFALLCFPSFFFLPFHVRFSFLSLFPFHFEHHRRPPWVAASHILLYLFASCATPSFPYDPSAQCTFNPQQNTLLSFSSAVSTVPPPSRSFIGVILFFAT